MVLVAKLRSLPCLAGHQFYNSFAFLSSEVAFDLAFYKATAA